MRQNHNSSIETFKSGDRAIGLNSHSQRASGYVKSLKLLPLDLLLQCRAVGVVERFAFGYERVMTAK